MPAAPSGSTPQWFISQMASLEALLCLHLGKPRWAPVPMAWDDEACQREKLGPGCREALLGSHPSIAADPLLPLFLDGAPWSGTGLFRDLQLPALVSVY